MESTPSVDRSIGFDIVYNAEGGSWLVEDAAIYQRPLLRYVLSIPGVLYRWGQEAAEVIERENRPENFTFPGITFGLANTQRVNCYATKRGDHYYVAMSGLVPICALELAYYFFADKNFFEDIGKPLEQSYIQLDGIETLPFFQLVENRYWPLVWEGLEPSEGVQLFTSICQVRGNTRRFDHETGRLLSAEQYLQQNFPVVDLLRPRCPVRDKHCEYVAKMLCTFFWLHEIAHVTEGHLDALGKERGDGSTRLAEFPNYALGQMQYSELRQAVSQEIVLAMEFDADVEALIVSVGLILDDLDIDPADTLGNRYQRIELFVFFLVAMFGSIAAQNRRTNLLDSPSHPPAQFRLVNLLKYLTGVSSVDQDLEKAMVAGVRRALEIGSYGKFAYLRSVVRLETNDEYMKWHAVDLLRASGGIVDSGHLHGNLRLLAHSFLSKLRDAGHLARRQD